MATNAPASSGTLKASAACGRISRAKPDAHSTPASAIPVVTISKRIAAGKRQHGQQAPDRSHESRVEEGGADGLRRRRLGLRLASGAQPAAHGDEKRGIERSAPHDERRERGVAATDRHQQQRDGEGARCCHGGHLDDCLDLLEQQLRTHAWLQPIGADQRVHARIQNSNDLACRHVGPQTLCSLRQSRERIRLSLRAPSKHNRMTRSTCIFAVLPGI